MVTHQVGEGFSPDAWLDGEKKVIGHLPREIKWVMSWYLPEQQLLLAHWDAPTAQAIRVALERSGLCKSLPILKIETAVEMYPKRYVARRNAAHARCDREHSAPHKKSATVHKHAHHAPRELSGAYAEAIASVLQVRAAEHLNLPRTRSN
jgi:hypothetical protein